jgi:transcriptional regulator with XRE-family HTH domain
MKVTKTYTSDISRRLKELRAMRKISQEKMAELMGITFSNYLKIENAYQNLTIKHLKSISQILNISIDTLVFGTIENSPRNLNFDDYIALSKSFNEDELLDLSEKLQRIAKLKNSQKEKLFS